MASAFEPDAEFLDLADLAIEDLDRHPVARNAVADHAAGGWQGIEDRDGTASISW